MLPTKEKSSKMTVELYKASKEGGGTQLGEVEFNMADYNYGEYKYRTMHLAHCDENTVEGGGRLLDFDPEVTTIEVGLRGTKQDGLVAKRMNQLKSQMDNSIKDIMKGAMQK